jgi:hypothetical protein
MSIKNCVLDYIRYKQLNWYGHVQRMVQERLPRRILEWCPPGRRRKGRPRNFLNAGGHYRNERAGNKINLP